MTRASTQQKRNFLRYDRDLRNTNKAKRNPCGDTENGYSKHEFKIKCENSHEKEKWKPAYKPGSVESSHSSAILVTKHLKRPTREPRGPRVCPPIWSCSGWGLPCHAVLPRMRCALTAPFQPYLCHPRRPSAVCFLRHFPSAHAAQALPGTLPIGARTFLHAHCAATARPTSAFSLALRLISAVVNHQNPLGSLAHRVHWRTRQSDERQPARRPWRRGLHRATCARYRRPAVRSPASR